MQESCTLTIYINTLDKIVKILQKHVESLDTFDDIEEIVNIIHFLQKESWRASNGERKNES